MGLELIVIDTHSCSLVKNAGKWRRYGAIRHVTFRNMNWCLAVAIRLAS